MRQYCRYCAHCFEGDGYVCDGLKHARHLTEEQIKRPNRCKAFDLTDDVITGREYQPREYRPRAPRTEETAAEEYRQLTLF